MLVLSRYRDESIYIGDDIVVTIVDIRGDRVRLGIQAPANVSVHRQEIYDAIMREKRGREAEEAKGPTKKVPLRPEKPEPQKGSGLPLDMDTPNLGFGGVSDIVPQ